MNRKQITTFLSLIETESMSKTAKILDITQSTVSSRISSLEEEVNAILLKRGRGVKGTKPTINGKSFALIARAWLELFEQTENWQKDSSHATLVIGSLETLNTCIFSNFYSQIIERKDELKIKLQIRTRIASGLYDLVKDHGIDLGLTVHPIFNETVSVQPLFSEEYRLVCPCGIVCAPTESVEISSLDIRNEVYLPWEQYFNEWHEETIGLASDAVISADLLPLANIFMLNPQNWIIAPQSAANEIARYTGKQVRKLRIAPQERTCYLIKNKTPIYDRVRSMNLIEAELIKYLKTIDCIKML